MCIGLMADTIVPGKALVSANCVWCVYRIDGRHYNAWYGIGLTYYKQVKYPTCWSDNNFNLVKKICIQIEKKKKFFGFMDHFSPFFTVFIFHIHCYSLQLFSRMRRSDSSILQSHVYLHLCSRMRRSDSSYLQSHVCLQLCSCMRRSDSSHLQ